MKKLSGFIFASIIATVTVGFGANSAYAATCNIDNMCSFDRINYEGTSWQGGMARFVDVPDDRTASAKNRTGHGYNAQNNTAFGKEETIAYIRKATWVDNFGGDVDKIDHYRQI